MERQVEVTLIARDECSRSAQATPLEQMQAALELLRHALEAPGMKAALPPEFLGGASAASCVTNGLRLLVAGWHGLDTEAKTALAREAITLLKTVLPVKVSWDIFGDDDEVIGRVDQHLSQREAEERFGL